MKPICVKCQRFYRPKKPGYFFIEAMPTENGASPGTAEPEKWKPNKLWCGDLWVCHGCGSEVVSGVGQDPVAEHYQPEFHPRIEAFQAKLQVNDC